MNFSLLRQKNYICIVLSLVVSTSGSTIRKQLYFLRSHMKWAIIPVVVISPLHKYNKFTTNSYSNQDHYYNNFVHYSWAIYSTENYNCLQKFSVTKPRCIGDTQLTDILSNSYFVSDKFSLHTNIKLWPHSSY